MLDRTRKRVGHVREREVGGQEKEKRKRRSEESMHLDGQHVTEFFYYVCLRVVVYDNVHMYRSNSQLTN